MKELNQEFNWGWLRGTPEAPFVLLKDCITMTMCIEPEDIRELFDALNVEPEAAVLKAEAEPVRAVDACLSCGDYSPSFECTPAELETETEGTCFYCGGPMVRHKLG
jgi:hypothetical protein